MSETFTQLQVQFNDAIIDFVQIKEITERQKSLGTTYNSRTLAVLLQIAEKHGVHNVSTNNVECVCMSAVLKSLQKINAKMKQFADNEDPIIWLVATEIGV